VRWWRGALDAVDVDVSAEAVVGALGGPRCLCVELCDAWVRAAADDRSLWLAELSDRLEIADHTILATTGDLRHQELLLALPVPLRRRFIGDVVARILDQADDHSTDSEALLAEITARVARRTISATLEATIRSHVDVTVTVRHAEEAVAGARDATRVNLEVVVRPTWLRDVWARELDTIDGRSVIAVDLRASPPIARTLEWVSAVGGELVSLRDRTIQGRQA
jgi:hypothetical protein